MIVHIKIFKKDRTNGIVDFALLANYRVKIKESEKRDEYRDLARELKTMEHEGDGDISGNWCTRKKKALKDWYNE